MFDKKLKRENELLKAKLKLEEDINKGNDALEFKMLMGLSEILAMYVPYNILEDKQKAIVDMMQDRLQHLIDIEAYDYKKAKAGYKITETFNKEGAK